MPQYDKQQWLDLGPAEVTWDSEVLGKTSANPNGGTHGGVSIQLAIETRDAMRDAEGTNPHDTIIVGRKMTVKAALTGMSLKQLQKCIPGSTLSTGPGSKSLKILNPVGTSMRDNAKTLIVKSILDDTVSTDEREWIQVPLAYPMPEFDFAFSLDNQKVYNVTFVCLNSLATGQSGIIATIGDNATATPS